MSLKDDLVKGGHSFPEKLDAGKLVPSQLVPVYQYRVKQIRGGWFDTDAAGIAELRKHPFDRYEFRTLYRGWE